MVLLASISAENVQASALLLVEEEEAVEAGNATIMTNQTVANRNMTGETTSTN